MVGCVEIPYFDGKWILPVLGTGTVNGWELPIPGLRNIAGRHAGTGHDRTKEGTVENPLHLDIGHYRGPDSVRSGCTER